DVWNLYGPTETTIWSTRQQVQDASGPTIPIGRPVGNTQAYVLDANGQRVPIGVVGELYLGGAGVARGYRGRPALTAEKFIPDAFSGAGGARLYRTGDLARYRADGTLEYVGRIDHQIKLRGFRIELGEIEAVLRQQPGVRDGVVQPWEAQPGDTRLVAYVVRDSDVTFMSQTWRQALMAHLPSYMVPSIFVPLDALPLTPNGKIDRRALPTPDALSLDNDAPTVAPATPTEEQLAALWSELLRQPVIGRHDEFFMLGGHSLLATQLVAHVRATLGVELPLRVVFEAPTLAGLAARIDALRDTDATQMPPLVAVERDQALPLSFAQQRLWFLDQLTPHSAAYNVPLALRLHGALDVAALQSSLDALVVRHEALRTTFQLHDGEPVQVIAPPQPLPILTIDLEDQLGAERAAQVAAAVQQAATTPFDLEQGPLLRVTLVRVAATEHVLLLSMHHIITDGWSLGVLLRELSVLYTAHVSGQSAALPALAVQYADYALWQRQWVTGAVLDRQLGYWRQQLAGLPPVLELPSDRPRPAVPSHQGARVRFTVDAAVTAGVRQLSQAAGVTLFMTLLGVWQGLLSRLSGQDDIAVGTSVANRTQA
ncbi:MAG TPA: condensation domain-containing protein, partial [Herpetosiphonaceae bacterium]